jgi:hypothetical protein
MAVECCDSNRVLGVRVGQPLAIVTRTHAAHVHGKPVVKRACPCSRKMTVTVSAHARAIGSFEERVGSVKGQGNTNRTDLTLDGPTPLCLSGHLSVTTRGLNS